MVVCWEIFYQKAFFGKFCFEFSEKNYCTMASDDKVFSREPPFNRLLNFFADLFEKPVVWFRENVVEPNRQEYYWYHEKLRRVPTVDQCYTDDAACIYEANQQYKRDREVDKFILQILRRRQEYCAMDNLHDSEVCTPIKETYKRAVDNYFIKYGDIGWNDSAIACLTKQKNRMAFERRHGPVGSGRKPQKEQFKKAASKTC